MLPEHTVVRTLGPVAAQGHDAAALLLLARAGPEHLIDVLLVRTGLVALLHGPGSARVFALLWMGFSLMRHRV
jgi:hypothetical protein